MGDMMKEITPQTGDIKMRTKKSQSAAQKSNLKTMKPEHEEKEKYIRSRIRKIWLLGIFSCIREYFIVVEEIPIDIKFVRGRGIRDMEYNFHIDVSCKYSFLAWIFLK